MRSGLAEVGIRGGSFFCPGKGTGFCFTYSHKHILTYLAIA